MAPNGLPAKASAGVFARPGGIAATGGRFSAGSGGSKAIAAAASTEVETVTMAAPASIAPEAVSTVTRPPAWRIAVTDVPVTTGRSRPKCCRMVPTPSGTGTFSTLAQSAAHGQEKGKVGTGGLESG